MNLTLTIFALATLWTPARAAIITRQSTCGVRNGGTGVDLNVSGPNDCSLSTSSGPLGSFGNVFAQASTVGDQLYVSASALGFSPIGCCIFPYTTGASSSASVEEDYRLMAFGLERPGVLHIAVTLAGAQLEDVTSNGIILIPGLLGAGQSSGLPAGCSNTLNTCDFLVTLGQVYPLSLIANADFFGSSAVATPPGTASATVQFFESDGTTPAAFTLDAPVTSGVPEPDSAILACLGIFVLFAFRQKTTAPVRSTNF
jgi:hypothetical protein